MNITRTVNKMRSCVNAAPAQVLVEKLIKEHVRAGCADAAAKQTAKTDFLAHADAVDLNSYSVTLHFQYLGQAADAKAGLDALQHAAIARLQIATL